jgi:glycosyltransferase involved in cell wall biosynthesis
MSRILLVQPAAGERLSGGYLYNAQMAAHGAWTIRSLAADQLEQGLRDSDQESDSDSDNVGDLVIADSIWLREETIAPFLALQARGIRLAVMMHSFPSMIAAAEDGQSVRSHPTAFELDTLEQVGLVVTPGPHYAEMLRGRRVRVAICEPGVADAWRTPPRPRRGPCALISVGAVTPRKGFRDVLEALLQTPPRMDFRWSVVGSQEADPGYAGSVAELARQVKGVSLLGQKDPDEVRRLVVASDVLVMPSYDENHPLVLLEAMAASVPAVGYQAGAAAHMLGHGARGLLGPIGDRATLAGNLARLIDDEAERQRLAEACWEHQRQLPGWAAAAANARRMLDAELDPDLEPA